MYFLLLHVELQRDRENQGQTIGESPSMAQIQNKQNRDQLYLAARVGQRGQQQLPTDTDTYKSDSADYIEDICPYATFQLSKPAYSESSYSGNVYSGPYHSVRGSFVYHDVKPPPSDKFNLGRVSFFISSVFSLRSTSHSFIAIHHPFLLFAIVSFALLHCLCYSYFSIIFLFKIGIVYVQREWHCLNIITDFNSPLTLRNKCQMSTSMSI